MTVAHINCREFLKDRQGRLLSDALDDPEQPIDALLEFFNRADRRRQMEEPETDDKKAAAAAVVRDLEVPPGVLADRVRANRIHVPGLERVVAACDPPSVDLSRPTIVPLPHSFPLCLRAAGTKNRTILGPRAWTHLTSQSNAGLWALWVVQVSVGEMTLDYRAKMLVGERDS